MTHTSPANPSSAIHLANAFAESLCTTANAHTETSWESRVSHQSVEAVTHDTLCVALRLAGVVAGELYVTIQRNGAAGLLTAPAGAPARDLQDSWLAFVRDAGARLTAQIPSGLGAISVDGCSTNPAPRGLVFLANVELRGAHGITGAVFLHMSPELKEALTEISAPAQPVVQPFPLTADGRAPLQRIIDVPLQVTLRFGQRQLTLREVLALTSGSLVELDRQVEEPVDLMLGERIVARGEVVIVDGNYGLRVTEVVERSASGSRLPAPATFTDDAMSTSAIA